MRPTANAPRSLFLVSVILMAFSLGGCAKSNEGFLLMQMKNAGQMAQDGQESAEELAREQRNTRESLHEVAGEMRRTVEQMDSNRPQPAL